MKRKFKEGYYCCIDYTSLVDRPVVSILRQKHVHLQAICDREFTCDYDGMPILDIRFYSPEHKKVTMEEATEVVKEKKSGWVNVFKGNFMSWVAGPYDTREQAEEVAEFKEYCIDCVQIQWKE